MTSHCAVACCAEIIGAKWTALLVHDLSEGPRRFSELEYSCSGISPRTLSERLRLLEQEGLVLPPQLQRDAAARGVRVTDKGASLLPIIKAMSDFGHAWLVPEHDHSHDLARAR